MAERIYNRINKVAADLARLNQLAKAVQEECKNGLARISKSKASLEAEGRRLRRRLLKCCEHTRSRTCREKVGLLV